MGMGIHGLAEPPMGFETFVFFGTHVGFDESPLGFEEAHIGFEEFHVGIGKPHLG